VAAHVVDRLDELGPVVSNAVDARTHAVGIERIFLGRHEETVELGQVGGLGQGRVEPAVPGRFGNDDRHAVVDRPHEVVRTRRHDREGTDDLLGVRVLPAGP